MCYCTPACGGLCTGNRVPVLSRVGLDNLGKGNGLFVALLPELEHVVPIYSLSVAVWPTARHGPDTEFYLSNCKGDHIPFSPKIGIMEGTTKDREALEKFVEKGELLPDRGDYHDENIKWRHGKLDYTKVNLAFFQGRSQKHAIDSLNLFVENAVKRWEMEAHHKVF